MCRCDYGVCKVDCDCRCHSESTGDKIARLQKELKTTVDLVNQAWITALHNNSIVDMVDADGENRKAILAMVDEEMTKLQEQAKNHGI